MNIWFNSQLGHTQGLKSDTFSITSCVFRING